MGGKILQTGSMILMVGTLILFVSELFKWKRNDLIGSRIKILRICQFIIIEALLVLAFLWPPVFQYRNPVAQLIYWMIAVILGLSIIIVALLDVREVLKQLTQMHKKVYKELKDDREEK